MQEQSTMEVIRWYISILFVFAILVFFIFFYQMSETNRFQSYVNTQIERYAGLTPQAVENIEVYSEQNFGGRYSIASDDMGVEQNYGDVVDYRVDATYKLIFDVLGTGDNPRTRSTYGQARVLVRGGSG